MIQGGRSRGQHDLVHGFPEPVKSFITFVILSQILCGKVQKKPHKRLRQSLHKTASKLSFGLLQFPRLPRPTEEKKNGKFSAIGYTLQLVKVIWKTAVNPGQTFTQFCEEKYEDFFALYRMKFDLV